MPDGRLIEHELGAVGVIANEIGIGVDDVLSDGFIGGFSGANDVVMPRVRTISVVDLSLEERNASVFVGTEEVIDVVMWSGNIGDDGGQAGALGDPFGEFDGSVVARLVVVESDDDDGRVLKIIESLKKKPVVLSAAECDGMESASDDGESVDGAFGEETKVLTEGVGIKEIDGRIGVVLEAIFFVTIGVDGSGCVVIRIGGIAVRDNESVGIGVVAEPEYVDEGLDIGVGEAAGFEIIDGRKFSVAVRGHDLMPIADVLFDAVDFVVHRLVCRLCRESARSDTSKFDSAVDSLFAVGRKVFDFGDDVNDVAVEVTSETVNGVSVGVELHRGVVVGMVFADTLEHAAVIGRMSDADKVIEEMRFSVIEIGAVEGGIGGAGRGFDGRRVDARRVGGDGISDRRGGSRRVGGRRVNGRRVSGRLDDRSVGVGAGIGVDG